MKRSTSLGQSGRLALASTQRRQCGAALLMAMLILTLVATLATAALWQQHRSIEVETAERGRLQSAMILTGALDWARLILREDARTGGADYLAEPWAVPLEEARLSSFLAVDGVVADNQRNAFLSGSIVDMQGRLNLAILANSADGSAASSAGVASFKRLFALLDLPPQTLAVLINNYVAASKQAARLTQALQAGASAVAPPASQTAAPATGEAADLLMPQRLDQLAWLGLDTGLASVLEPYVTVLPVSTPVNLNTASALVIAASTPGLDLAGAEKLVAARARKHFSSLADATQALNGVEASFVEARHSVSSRFFEVRGQLRLDQLAVFERSLVQRDGLDVRTLWRARGSASVAADASGTDLAVRR